ncbi:MAG: cation diffusion facilitator family transporter [Spirochaetia bacterium]
MNLERSRGIRTASWIAIVGNAFLAFLKIAGGLFSGSLAVVGDGVDSFSDIISSVISLFAAVIIAKPADPKHPYGHHRAETIATSLLAFIMFFVGVELIQSSVGGIINPEDKEVPRALALWITGLSILGKTGLALYLRICGKRIESSMLAANGKNMQNDVLISSGVLIGLLFAVFFTAPIVDSILAVAIGLWVIVSAVRIFLDINTELMEGIEDRSVYEDILKAVEDTQGAVNPHRTRVRKLSSCYVIDLDIEVDGKKTVDEAHAIAVKVEETIKDRIENIYDIIVHVEPKGNYEESEKYGVSRDS